MRFREAAWAKVCLAAHGGGCCWVLAPQLSIWVSSLSLWYPEGARRPPSCLHILAYSLRMCSQPISGGSCVWSGLVWFSLVPGGFNSILQALDPVVHLSHQGVEVTRSLRRADSAPVPWVRLFLVISYLSLTALLSTSPHPCSQCPHPQRTGERKFSSLWPASPSCFLGTAFKPNRRSLSIYFKNQHFSLICDLFQGPEACLTSSLSLKLTNLCKSIPEEPQGGDFWNYLRNDLSFHSNPALWSHHHIPGSFCFHWKGCWRNRSLLNNHSRGRDGLHLPCPSSLFLPTLLPAHLACLSMVWKQQTPTQHSLVISTLEKTGSC